MAEISVAARMFKKFTVRIGDDADVTAATADDYAPAVAECRFVPATTTSTWKGGTPASVFTDVSTPTWTCVMRVGQDWENADSLVNFLFANAGLVVPLDFVPVDGGAKISAAIIVAPPEIGGAIDAWGETTVTHGVNGAPTITPAV